MGARQGWMTAMYMHREKERDGVCGHWMVVSSSAGQLKALWKVSRFLGDKVDPEESFISLDKSASISCY